MSKSEKITYIILYSIGVTLVAVFTVWWFRPSHVSHNFKHVWHIFDYIIFLLLSYIVWHEIMLELFSWYIAAYIKPSNKDKFGKIPTNLRVAYATAFVPGAEPYSVLEKTLKAMVEVDYPHDTWLLDEGNDPTSKEICKKYGVKHFSRKGNDSFNTDTGRFAKKTKGGNYNAWLHHYENDYDIVAQHDVDFIPRKDFLTQTLPYFNDSDVAFVGTPQVYGNLDESWIARGAAEQTYGFYGPYQRSLSGHGMTLLIGANHIMRMAAYKDIDGYTAHITEDMLTGMKLYTYKWKSVYVPETLLIGEGPSTWSSYFGQQMRWAYGCMDIMFRHAPTHLPKMKRGRIFNYMVLMQFYFSGVLQVAGVVLLTLYFFLDITSANMTLRPILMLYVPILLFQMVFQLWLNRFNIDPKKEKGLMLRGKLLSLAAWPIYFLAFIGVVRGKRLTYVVTPKGDNQTTSRTPLLFILHFILGTITLVGILVGFYLGHHAPIMIFWALINTIFMYFFFFSEALPNLKQYLKKFIIRKPLLVEDGII
jgi:cellulose synthase/poly-beta-1,6-N-acetylglucosamine synthase-like glycosyltransferase